MANSKDSAFNIKSVQYCKYCNKECKSINSLKQHECRCKNNPNRKISSLEQWNLSEHVVWNYGLTKETDERVAKIAHAQSITKKGKPGHPHTEEFKNKQRENALKNGLGGFNMRRGIYYNGIKLDSSYEVVVAESLDSKWERPGRFPYHMDNKLHYYTPDFYLPEYNIYLDPKNDFLIENINPNLEDKDSDKINQVMLENDIKIIILNKNQLSWEQIQTMLP